TSGGTGAVTRAVPHMISTIGEDNATLTPPQMVSTIGEDNATLTLPQIVSTKGDETTTPVFPLMATTPGPRLLTPPSPPHITTKQQNISYIDSSLMHGGLEEAPVLSGSSARHGGLNEVAVLVVVSSFCLVLLVILVIVVFRCLILRRGKYYTHEQNEAEDPKDELEDFSDKDILIRFDLDALIPFDSELLGEVCPMNEQNDVEDIKE
ncbi:mucin-2-like isoform X1, partial [Clarias magur]